MTQKERDNLRKEIKIMIAKLTREIALMEESAGPVTPENAIGRISRMDAINNKSVVEASLRHRRRKLMKLQLAQSKIDDPGFGLCTRCKGPIQAKRMLLMPESDKCVKCA